MTVQDAIIHFIRDYAYAPDSVTAASHLYRDLGFDSLSFTSLLVEIEDRYGITFAIAEMEACLWVSRLIEVAENKIKERDKSHDQACAAQPEKLG